MKRIFFLLPVLCFIKASAQEPYYDFKKFRENSLSKDSLKRHLGKIQPGKAMGKITWSDPTGTFVLPLDKNMSTDSLQKIMELIRKRSQKQYSGTLIFIQPNGTRLYALPQDQMICLVPDISQFNMPVMGKEIRTTGMPPVSVPRNNIIPEK